MKKIGLLSLALVLALGALGVGYAAWTDTITIEGTVNTGSVDINAIKFSGTEVWKNLDTDEAVVIYYIWDADGNVIHQSADQPGNGILVAYAHAEPGTADDTVVFEFDNLFPSINFVADVFLHYEGTVPAKVNLIDWEVTSGQDWINPLIDNGDIMGLARIWNPETHEILEDEVVEEGYQLHYCDWVWLALIIHLPQDNDLMNQSGTATATIEVVQWNEYPH